MEKQIANMQYMQKINRLKVLNYIHQHPDCSRTIIARDIGLSLASLTNIVSYLLENDMITECGTENVGRVGKKSTLLRISSSYNLLCIFISEEKINIIVCDLLGNVKTSKNVSIENLALNDVMNIIKSEVFEITNTVSKLLAVGVAISALVLNNNEFILSSNLKWKSYDIRQMIKDITPLPIYLDNISPIRALYHFRSDNKYQDKNALFVDLKNGIGSAQFIQNKINFFTLGEIGHTTVEKDGAPCFCGNRGCLEAMCSPKRLLSLYEASTGKKITMPDINTLFMSKDANACFAVKECAKFLGIGLGNLVNLFNPSFLVINSGDFGDVPSLIKESINEMYTRALPALTEKIQVEIISQNQINDISGMTLNLCDRIFDVNNPESII